MMKLVAPALIAGVFGAAGGAAAVYIKTGSSAPAQTAAHAGGDGGEEAAGDHGAAPKKEKSGHGEDKGHGKAKDGHGGKADAGDAPAYYKFSREFVVPIIEDERVKSLVILNLNLQVNSSASQALFSQEPVLRDNIMSTLIALSGDDTIFNSLNNVEHYETIRSMILTNLQESVSGEIQNVLILDMARQDL